MELLAQPHGRGAGSGSSTFAFRYGLTDWSTSKVACRRLPMSTQTIW